MSLTLSVFVVVHHQMRDPKICWFAFAGYLYASQDLVERNGVRSDFRTHHPINRLAGH